MSKEAIQMNRKDWEIIREYKKVPFKAKYLKLLEMAGETDFKKD